MIKNSIFASVLATIAAGLVSCSTQTQQQDSTSVPTTNTTPVSSRQSGTNTQIDQNFIEMMIPHHQGAVDMAKLALSKAKHPEIKQLAEAIIKDQNREIQQMQTWNKQWYGREVPVSSTAMMANHANHQNGMGMMNMMDMEMMKSLKNSSNFDLEFIRQMIPHHQMAVMMAQMVANSAIHPEIQNLAQSIIKSQNAEIEQMWKWEQTWNQ